MGGANQIPGKIEHKYNHPVKVVKQTEGGQSKRDERVSFERNQKFHTSDKQERDTTLQYQFKTNTSSLQVYNANTTL